MAKTLLNLAGGAVMVTEDAGVVTIAIDESLKVGGGEAAGIVSLSGKACVVLNGTGAEQLGFAAVNKEIPASLQGAAVAVEGVIEAAESAIE